MSESATRPTEDAAEVDAVAKLTNRFLSATVVEESDVQEGVADQS